MLCGRLVCSNCYEPVDGVCKICARIPKGRRTVDDTLIRPDLRTANR